MTSTAHVPMHKGHHFQGILRYAQLQNGLSMHCTDGTHTQSICTHSSISPRINLLIVLKGQCHAIYGDTAFTFGSSLTNSSITSEISLVAFSEQESFQRVADEGEHVSKLVLGLEQQWLENVGLSTCREYQQIIDFQQKHLTQQRVLNCAAIENMTQRILMTEPDHFCQRLLIQGLTIELASTALNLLSPRSEQSISALSSYEQKRVSRVIELLKACQSSTELSLDEISRQVGSNSTTLQQHFRLATGMSIFEYLRTDKLTQAKTALETQHISITEAALLAGYSSSSNFATAFKRLFGLTPRQVQRQIF
ncbi:AraC family transcriptional regulator [Pseudomonas sp. F1_0610]|uniref:helix-turn-helix transcriptional regulator n=1 Tax=Pseudomonas sp. F1_0610 TaxID=3114284 RepID=UPI0039C17558